MKSKSLIVAIIVFLVITIMIIISMNDDSNKVLTTKEVMDVIKSADQIDICQNNDDAPKKYLKCDNILMNIQKKDYLFDDIIEMITHRTEPRPKSIAAVKQTYPFRIIFKKNDKVIAGTELGCLYYFNIPGNRVYELWGDDKCFDDYHFINDAVTDYVSANGKE